jgi:hypothetical protein
VITREVSDPEMIHSRRLLEDGAEAGEGGKAEKWPGLRVSGECEEAVAAGIIVSSSPHLRFPYSPPSQFNALHGVRHC